MSFFKFVQKHSKCPRTTPIPEFDQMVKNMKSSDLVDWEEIELMINLLKTIDSDGEMQYYTNSECDSNQTPFEAICSRNHLKVMASSKEDAALLLSITKRLMAWWNLSDSSHRPFSWYHDSLDSEVFEEYEDVDQFNELLETESEKSRNYIWYFISSQIDHTLVCNPKKTYCKNSLPSNYIDALKVVYRKCDPCVRYDVITKQSLISFFWKEDKSKKILICYKNENVTNLYQYH